MLSLRMPKYVSMPTLLDLLYVALFAVVLPLWDYLVWWPAHRQRPQSDPSQARMRLWKTAIFTAWPLTGAGAALWVSNGRPWKSLGLNLPEGWRVWAFAAVFMLLSTYYVFAAATLGKSPEQRANVRKQFTPGIIAVLPHTRAEMVWFAGVSLTAGFCEEFLFRGFFIWALSPWLGWWGAAALSLLIFASGHAYQGRNGVIRTGIVGAIFTLVVAIFGSLWPAIALHVLVDFSNGLFAWLTLREGTSAYEPQPVGPDPIAAP